MTATQNIRRAQAQDRVRNIFSATVAEVPSLNDAQLTALIQGQPIPGSPAREETSVKSAADEYDRALRALTAGMAPLVAGIELAVRPMTDAMQQAVERATEVALKGAAVHSVINALNIVLIASDVAPVSVQRSFSASLLRATDFARNGLTEPLAVLVRQLVSQKVDAAEVAARTRLVEETFASWALEDMVPDARDRADARDYIEGKTTPSELIARLKAEYGAQ